MADKLTRLEGGFWCAVALGAAAALSACGGGGGGSGDGSAAGPTGFVDTRDAQTSATSDYADAQRTAVFDAVNAARKKAGLGVLRQSAPLDSAAQSHATYVSTNNAPGEQELAGVEGFSGRDVTERAVAAGYAPSDIVESTTSVGGTADGAALFDLTMGAPYHRMRVFSYAPSEIGIGYSAMPPGNLVLDIAHSADNAQGAPKTPVTYWPRDGDIDVPLTGCCEVPEPLGLEKWGYPVSVQVHEKKVLSVISFKLTGPDGAAVASTRLDASTDRTLVDRYKARYVAFLLPLLPLEPNKVYTASFAGLAEGVAFERRWTFRTATP